MKKAILWLTLFALAMDRQQITYAILWDEESGTLWDEGGEGKPQTQPDKIHRKTKMRMNWGQTKAHNKALESRRSFEKRTETVRVVRRDILPDCSWELAKKIRKYFRNESDPLARIKRFEHSHKQMIPPPDFFKGEPPEVTDLTTCVLDTEIDVGLNDGKTVFWLARQEETQMGRLRPEADAALNCYVQQRIHALRMETEAYRVREIEPCGALLVKLLELDMPKINGNLERKYALTSNLPSQREAQVPVRVVWTDTEKEENSQILIRKPVRTGRFGGR